MKAGERVELEALRSLFEIPGAPGTMREAGGALAIRADGTTGRVMHRIVGMYDLDVLEELTGIYAEHTFWVSLDPAAGLDDELVSRGFVTDGAWQKFQRDVEPAAVSRTDLVIADARTPEDFGAVIAATWGLPPPERAWLSALVALPSWHCFVAYDGAEPVGGGALFESEGVGWLGIASTLASHRGRGAQGAILAARIARATQLGLTRLVTETDAPDNGERNQSYRNILRAGFEPSYVRPNYVSASLGSASSSGSAPPCRNARA